MGRIWALGDLHLSSSGEKPMDVFGELWRDHAIRMAERWDALVAPDDTVLVAGDISWGRTLADAAPDLAWIGQRPGRKILLRGNHDGWWASAAKVRRAVPPNCEILHNGALRAGRFVVVGARGWTAPDDPTAKPGDDRIFARELQRLALSIAAADRELDRSAPRLALLHFPPWIEGRGPTPVVAALIEAGVRVCVYGHLHGADHRLAVRGHREGIRFVFAAADAVDFTPVEVEDPS